MLRVGAVDLAGNEATEIVVSWLLDTLAPRVWLVGLLPVVTNQRLMNLTLAFSESLSFLTYLIGGDSTSSSRKVNASSAVSRTAWLAVRVCCDGTFSLNVTAMDLAGNMFTNASLATWTVDT